MTAPRTRRWRGRTAPLLIVAAVVGLIATSWTVWTNSASSTPQPRATTVTAAFRDIVPQPVSVTPDPSVHYQLSPGTAVFAAPGSPAARGIGTDLARELRRLTGFPVPVVPAPPMPAPVPGISLQLTGADPSVGDEGYELNVDARSVVIRANTPAGLFHGVQTLRQLLPVRTAGQGPAGPWNVPAGHVLDHPRYAYRGAMLDVARHFLPVADVERYIDEIALYKVNHLHLHLADDQGWRLAITGWPRLTSVGARTNENGGRGGYYTQDQYRQIVAYAAAHYVTIVPEIDMPAHAGAALSSYAPLNCDGTAPPIYTGNGSAPHGTLCLTKPVTYQFLNDVIGQVSALTPGSYVDVGGDEASGVSEAAYGSFFQKVQQIVAQHGKKLFGWAEMLTATDPAASTGEFWIYDGTQKQVTTASQHGATLIMAPCVYSYLDQKYAAGEPPDPLGEHWAGYINTKTAYGWDPTKVLPGAPANAISGVEAPLWTDTVTNLSQVQEMAFPRLPAIAEIGWSPENAHDWTSFRQRLAAQAPLWAGMGINFFHDPVIAWTS